MLAVLAVEPPEEEALDDPAQSGLRLARGRAVGGRTGSIAKGRGEAGAQGLG